VHENIDHLTLIFRRAAIVVHGIDFRGGGFVHLLEDRRNGSFLDWVARMCEVGFELLFARSGSLWYTFKDVKVFR